MAADKVSEEKAKILNAYIKLTKDKGFHPTRSDMIKAKVSRDRIRHHFGSHLNLRKEAKKFSPEVFANIIDESLFTPKRFKALKTEAGNFKRYFVTTAVTGCPVDANFLASIRKFNELNKAMLLVLPASDPAASAGEEALHSSLSAPDINIVFSDLALNKNLFLSSIKLSAKHIDPVTGLRRIGQRHGSFIYASPKQRLKMTATSNTKLPHAIMTTGAVTKPNYQTTRYMSDRTAYIANYDHVMGGIIVEILNDKIFHFRQVQADKNGRFVDLGIMYTPEGTRDYAPAALVLGDWHSGETDTAAKDNFVQGANSVLAVTKPSILVIHDGFNGRSISHHEQKNRILRAQRAALNELDLQSELEAYTYDLNELSASDDIEKIVVVYSNHDDFLYRYLAEARYVDDPHNHMISLKLAAEAVKGKNPVQVAVEWLGLKRPDKFVWLKRDDDFKIADIELGAHGDKGANGSRGSLPAMENGYGQSVSGHAHTPEILRGAWQVGTCSKLKLSYNEGMSSWLHTSCLVYENGSRQLINVIEGTWRLEE